MVFKTTDYRSAFFVRGRIRRLHPLCTPNFLASFSLFRARLFPSRIHLPIMQQSRHCGVHSRPTFPFTHETHLKYMDIRIHYIHIRDCVNRGVISIKHIPGIENQLKTLLTFLLNPSKRPYITNGYLFFVSMSTKNQLFKVVGLKGGCWGHDPASPISLTCNLSILLFCLRLGSPICTLPRCD